MKAEVLTAWVGDGVSIETANRPKLIDDYSVKMEDVTGQPSANLHPDPNLYIVQIECDQATLDLIDADPNYVIGWVE